MTFPRGAPFCRLWLSELLTAAVEAAERDCRRDRFGGLREDGSQFVLSTLVAATELPEAEQESLIARIVGQPTPAQTGRKTGIT